MSTKSFPVGTTLMALKLYNGIGQEYAKQLQVDPKLRAPKSARPAVRVGAAQASTEGAQAKLNQNGTSKTYHTMCAPVGVARSCRRVMQVQ